MTRAAISIIVPVLNEADILKPGLEALQDYRRRGHEVIVADGGSHDGSVEIAVGLADRIVQTAPGRSLQMNEGADAARHETLLFLHADTHLPENADRIILEALRPPEQRWGRFDLRLSGSRRVFRMIETAINWRTAITGIATGDQAIFVDREIFERVGFYDVIPLMEDVALSRKLLQYARPRRVTARVVSSSRRWEEYGVARTVLLMWWLRLAYFFGVSPSTLYEKYYPPTARR